MYMYMYMYITEKAMALHSSTLAWKIPWMEEPGGLQSIGSLRDGHNWATSFSLFTFVHWRRKWQPAPVFLPGESQGRGAWWAAVYGVAQSQTRLKWLSSSNSSSICLCVCVCVCVCIKQFIYPFIYHWISRLFQCLSYCKWCCNEHGGAVAF